MKKMLPLVLIIIMICSIIPCEAVAALTTEDLFGKFMPSAKFAIGMDAELVEQEEQKLEKYYNVGYEDFKRFGQYLTCCGCSLVQSGLRNGLYTAVVERDGVTITVEYHYGDQALTVFYPKGTTRPEKESKNASKITKKTDSLFQIEESGFTVLPSAIALFKVAPYSIEYEDGIKYFTYYDFGKAAFIRLCNYLEEYGCKLTSDSTEDGIRNRYYEYNDTAFLVQYYEEYTAAVEAYYEDTQVEGEFDCGIVGHQWTEATCDSPKTCSICGETEGNPGEHVCDKWSVIKEPALTYNGEKLGTCKYCGIELTEKIPCLISGMEDQGQK